MNRGFFEIKNVFGDDEYTEISRLLEEKIQVGQFIERPHHQDQDIEKHPLWMDSFPVSIQDKLVNYMNTTFIPSTYKFENAEQLQNSLSASFVMFYNQSNSNKMALSFHQDVSLLPDKHILSVVYTMKSRDCIGGTLEFSNRNDGKVTNTRDSSKYEPADNSIYCFNGDFVTHCAFGVKRGRRFAVVMFFNTPQTTYDVVHLWNRLDIYTEYRICENCRHILHTKKQLKDHQRCICKLCNTCYNSQSSFRKHQCNL